jgi:CheY-like chemotaxis protein
MTERPGRASIRKLATGVPGLDDVLGGGLPELSFNLIVGGPGCGKTTLAHQMMFANATPDRPGLYVTIVGEPPLKMLRYQQQYSFFDPAKVNGTIRFVSLSGDLPRGLAAVLESLVRQVEAASDIAMADEDGYALIRRIRARDAEHGGAIPALALTGYVFPEDRARLLAAGFQAHVGKPASTGRARGDGGYASGAVERVSRGRRLGCGGATGRGANASSCSCVSSPR